MVNIVAIASIAGGVSMTTVALLSHRIFDLSVVNCHMLRYKKAVQLTSLDHASTVGLSIDDKHLWK